MVGIFPFDAVMEKKPQGHGYTVLDVRGGEPVLRTGTGSQGT